jgi:ribonucleoside-diphosphate reductase alpha chain
MKKSKANGRVQKKNGQNEGGAGRSTKTGAAGEILLDIGRGESLVLPPRSTLVGGLRIPHFFSQKDIHPYDQCQWEKRDVSIMDYAKGKPSFHREDVEVPKHWSENSVRITAAKYLFGAEVGQPEYEDSLRHPFDRIANSYTVWGWKNGYFAELEDAKTYNWELKALLVRQIWAPNSPVWFNIGHWEQWRWGRPDLREIFSQRGNKAYKAFQNLDALEIREIPNSLMHPQASACFLTELDDSMESILGHCVTEGRIFSSGSGVGVNLSKLRSSYEPIAGRGRSSGPISFNKGWDRMAGAVKSGGRSRRAARMVILDSNHPDIFSFVQLKNSQEQIAKIILREHNGLVDLREKAQDKIKDGSDAERLSAALLLETPMVNLKKYDGGMDGEIYGETVSDQNANHSVSLRGDFWKAYWADGNYSTNWVTKPEKIHETFKARKLLETMAESVHDNAEPGCHNNDYINLWNPVKSKGRIDTSNPCSEYLHLNNTSCNLSSFNAYRFFKDGVIDTEALRAGARLAMIAADLNIEEGGFPIPDIAEGTYRYRTTGVGFGNIGGLLMSLGIPYDSDEGRWIAGLMTSELTAACWITSSEIASELGSYEEWDSTKRDLEEVLDLHKICHKLLLTLPEISEGTLFSEDTISELLELSGKRLPQAERLVGGDALRALARSFKLNKTWDPERLKAAKLLKSSSLWEQVDSQAPMRNSFVSLYAPMGTISAPLGIYDEGTTSAEPDYTLVKYKSLSGGGSMTMFNSLALRGVESMGYSQFKVREAALEVAGLNGLIVACGADIDMVCEHLSTETPQADKGPVRRAFENHPFPVGKDLAHLVRELVEGRNSEFSPDIVNGAGNVEQIPWMSEHHQEVFDCAATTGGGSRAIAPEGHIRMLGVLTPFISGAVSKTVNLPHYATREDILKCFEMSHQMGVKCIALYRADSKGVSVYMADSPEANRWKADGVWIRMSEKVAQEVGEIRKEASKPKRQKLPGQRPGQIIKFEIGGTLDGFLIIGTYPDGRCGEVFGRLGRCGSFAHGMFESFCKAFSVMLQWGVPIDKAISSFKNLAFDPAGFSRVAEGTNETEIKSCKSVVDLMMRILEWLFPAERNYRIRRDGYYDFPMMCGGEEIEFVHGSDNGEVVESKSDMGSAEMCPECHSLSMIQDGRCKRCSNCGFSNGGCGG